MEADQLAERRRRAVHRRGAAGTDLTGAGPLAARPLLDEPAAGLDLVARRRFLETLRRVARGGTTLILVTHHVEEILPEIGRVVLMRDGRVFKEGPTEEVLTTQNLSSLFGARVVVRRAGGYYTADVEADRVSR